MLLVPRKQFALWQMRAQLILLLLQFHVTGFCTKNERYPSPLTEGMIVSVLWSIAKQEP
jgi:hypothetical protein